MSSIFIIANWKMNPSSAKDAKELFVSVKKGIKKDKEKEIIICPPAVYLPLFEGLPLGVQNIFFEQKGAYTGEISAEMAKDAGCRYAIIGHSERRKYFGETDESVSKKMKAVLNAGLICILCVGETEEERKNGKTEEVVERQLKKALFGVSDFKQLIIAYEPVWAISQGDPYQTKEIPTPENIKKVNIFIRNLLAEIYNKETVDNISVIYGGSANGENARGFIKEAGMDGLLVGGASLKADEFLKIIKNID